MATVPQPKAMPKGNKTKSPDDVIERIRISMMIPPPGHPLPLGPLEEMLSFRGPGCTWIYGDARVRGSGWRCCGHPKVPSKSWCDFHATHSLDAEGQRKHERRRLERLANIDREVA